MLIVIDLRFGKWLTGDSKDVDNVEAELDGCMWRMPIHSSSPGAVNRPTSWNRRSWRVSRLHRWRRQQTCHQPGSPVTSRVWVRSYLIINSKWLEWMLPKNSEIVALISRAKLEAWPALEWISTLRIGANLRQFCSWCLAVLAWYQQ